MVVPPTLEYAGNGFVQKVRNRTHCDAVSQHGRPSLSVPNMSKICLLMLILCDTTKAGQQHKHINKETILTVFLCCFDDDDDDEEDGTVGFATEILTLGVGTFSFFPSGSSENSFLTSLFCNKKLLLVMFQ
jgi:hypothetical protein